MCQNANKTAVALMAGIQPTLVAFMNLEGVDTATQQQVISAYDAAEADVAAWTPGTSAETAVEAVNAVVAVFDTLPVPEADKDLAGVIDAGFTSVVAILEANETTDPVAQAEVIHAATVKVSTQAPGAFHYRKGIFAEFQSSPEKQFHSAWNTKVESKGEKYKSLLQA